MNIFFPHKFTLFCLIKKNILQIYDINKQGIYNLQAS